MSDFVIIPDTACDLVKELRDRFDITDYISGLVYFPDGHCEFSDIDWERHDPKQFFESMTDKKTIYKTACAPAGDIIQVFEKNLMVRKELQPQYPDRKIICIDSMRYSTALSMLVIAAAEKRREGLTLEETAEYIETNKHRLHQIGPMDDLFFLCKTGRISNFKAFFGTLVGISPMADFSRHGLAEVLGKFKGKKAAFDAVIAYMRETIQNPEEQILFVAHSNRQAAAEMLRDRILEEFHPKEVIINHVGMSCGCSIGPGLCAAFYWGDEISEGMVREKAIMNGIIAAQKQ